MGWRDGWCGCGPSGGCVHRDPWPLCITAGERITAHWAAPAPLPGPVRGQARAGRGGPLIIDLGPFITAPAEGELLLDVPGWATAPLRTSGVYDVWAGEALIVHGPLIVETPVSAGAGAVPLAGTWDPVLRTGLPFARAISTEGLLPYGEELSSYAELVLVITAADGHRMWTSGPPAVTVSKDGKDVLLALSGEDTALLRPGRYTYSVSGVTTTGDARDLLTGQLLTEEGLPHAEPVHR